MTEQEKWEKVINNLEYQIHLLYDIIPHVSRDDGEYLEAAAKTMSDALALLKAQEPMLVVSKDTNEIIGDCPRCGRHVIHWHNKYCAECGQAVKWE